VLYHMAVDFSHTQRTGFRFRIGLIFPFSNHMNFADLINAAAFFHTCSYNRSLNIEALGIHIYFRTDERFFNY